MVNVQSFWVRDVLGAAAAGAGAGAGADFQITRCADVKHEDRQTSCRGGKDDDVQRCRGGG
jgi:hypothetical protein